MMDAAVERCVAGSLLTWSVSGDVVIMHRLLGRVLRERDQSTGHWDATVKMALGVLEPQLPSVEDAWARREEGAGLISQIEALWEASADGSGDPDLTLRLLQARSWAVGQLLATANLSRSIDLGVQVLADSERLLGSDHPQTLSSRLGLARTYWAASRIGDAMRLSHATLADHERVLGRDHPGTIDSRLILAFAYEEAGRYDEAISMFEATLADCERVLGNDHPETLRPKGGLAGAYQAAGRLNEAIGVYEATLADCERVLGNDHPDTTAYRTKLEQARTTAGLDPAAKHGRRRGS